MRCWPEPTAGEIVWCHFPDHIHPKPKARPGLVVATKEDDQGMIFVSVAYGTSQKTNRLYRGELRITKGEYPAAYVSAGRPLRAAATSRASDWSGRSHVA